MTYFQKNLQASRRRQVLAMGTLIVATATAAATVSVASCVFVLAAVGFVVGNWFVMLKQAKKVR